MEIGTLYLTVATFTRIIFLLLLVLLSVIVYRWLIPHLSPASKRVASFMLVVQALTIGKSIFIEPSSSFDVWLWDLHREWNFPAAIASTQLALVGGVALVSAWLSGSSKAFQRLYFVGIAVVFLYLASDEYFKLHENKLGWDVFVKLGALVVAATLVVAARSKRQSWKWHFCMLTGLAISALGAIHIEQFGSLCGNYGLLHIDQCPQRTLWSIEEILEFLGIWLTLVAFLGHMSDVSPQARRMRWLLYLMPAFWIALLFLSAPMHTVARQVAGQPAVVKFESGASLHAYLFDKRKEDLTTRLFLSPARWNYDGLGYSIHLVDQVSGASIVSRDTFAHHLLEFSPGPGYVPVYRQWTRMEYPIQAPTNRAMWIVLSLWYERNGEYISQKVLSSDHRLLSQTQVVLGELVLPAASSTAANDPLATFSKGFALVAAELPERAQPGDTFSIPFAWYSAEAGGEDYTQFLHFVHAGTEIQWGFDQQPLGARLPTRLWYSGLADSETWQIPLPADLAPGRYAVFTGLYRQSDLERLPAKDADGTPFIDGRVPLGTIVIE